MADRPDTQPTDSEPASEEYLAYEHLKRAYERADDPEERFHLRHAGQYLLSELE